MTVEGLLRQQDAAEAGGRRWLMLAVLLLGQFMGLVDVFVVNVGLPSIAAGLHASGAALQLVVGGYTVAYAMLLITGARLGDLYGRRRMYLLGVLGFTAASLACGLAPNAATLVACRLVQGAAAATMIPQIMSVVQTRFTGAARAKALSAYGAVVSSGAAAGLVVGGVVVHADLFGLSWRPVFLVNVPIGILLAVLVPRLVPADRPSASSRRLDLAGLATVLPAIVLIVLPMVVGREGGWPWWTFAGMAAGAGLGVVFVLVERRTADPLVDLAVLRAPGLAAGLTAIAAAQITWGGFLFSFTLHMETALGLGPLRAGLAYLPMAVIFGLAGFHWRRVPAGVRFAVPSVGVALCAGAYLTMSLAPGGAPLWTAVAVLGLGLGLTASPLLTFSLARVPAAQAADASGLLTTALQLGQVVGVAAVGTVFLSAAGSLAVTARWLTALAVFALVPALALARRVRR
ncbi:MFS transporter [Streptosporangiaceae bacterium NEAU-GS5]|nr:MFS transporter [Streptosporangiaceae bacterium NEAU-GS5]